MENGNYLKKRFSRDPSIVARQIADEFILVPISQKAGEVESIYTMNNVGSYICELLDGEKQVVEIRDAITQEFEVETGQAETDLVDYLKQLHAAGAVREI